MRLHTVQTNYFKSLLWLVILLTILPVLKAYAQVDKAGVNVYIADNEMFKQVLSHIDPVTFQPVYIEDPEAACFTNSWGFLYVNGDYIPTEVREPICSRSIDIDTLNAISGKPLVQLADWNIVHKSYEKYFKRSAKTYSIYNVPYVILSAVNSSGGSGSKPTVTISTDQANATEIGPVSGRILISLNAAAVKDIKVSFTISGSAKNGKDYEAIPGNVVIPAGSVSALIDINPIDDLKREKTEKVKLTLKSRNTYNRSKVKAATVSITDND